MTGDALCLATAQFILCEVHALLFRYCGSSNLSWGQSSRSKSRSRTTRARQTPPRACPAPPQVPLTCLRCLPGAVSAQSALAMPFGFTVAAAAVVTLPAEACRELPSLQTAPMVGPLRERAQAAVGAPLLAGYSTALSRAGHGQRPDCLAGHIRVELRNVVANIPLRAPTDFRESSRIRATETIRV
jgi:hypothetical protein